MLQNSGLNLKLCFQTGAKMKISDRWEIYRKAFSNFDERIVIETRGGVVNQHAITVKEISSKTGIVFFTVKRDIRHIRGKLKSKHYDLKKYEKYEVVNDTLINLIHRIDPRCDQPFYAGHIAENEKFIQPLQVVLSAIELIKTVASNEDIAFYDELLDTFENELQGLHVAQEQRRQLEADIKLPQSADFVNALRKRRYIRMVQSWVAAKNITERINTELMETVDLEKKSELVNKIEDRKRITKGLLENGIMNFEKALKVPHKKSVLNNEAGQQRKDSQWLTQWMSEIIKTS